MGGCVGVERRCHFSTLSIANRWQRCRFSKKTHTHKKKNEGLAGPIKHDVLTKEPMGKRVFSFFVLMVREIFFGSNCLRWSTVSLQGQGGGAKIRPIGTRPFFFRYSRRRLCYRVFFSTEFLLFFLPRSRSTVIV